MENKEFKNYISFHIHKEEYEEKRLEVKIDEGLFGPEKEYKFNQIKFALFSEVNPEPSEETTKCSLDLYKNKSDELYLQFRFVNTEDDEEKKNIIECRDISYSLLKFYGIPIVIQSPYEKLDPSYFVEAASSSFQKFPSLAKLVYPEQIEICFIIFNPTIQLYYDIARNFVQSVDCLLPSNQEYRVVCKNSISEFTDSLTSFQIGDDLTPQYANTIDKYSYGKIFEGSPDVFCISYVDLGYPEETMYVASASSQKLFLTPDFGQVKFLREICDEKKEFWQFLFRPKKYDDPNNNSYYVTLKSAFLSSSVLVIPFTVPCADVIQAISMLARDHEIAKNLVKEIYFYAEVHEKSPSSNENSPSSNEKSPSSNENSNGDSPYKLAVNNTFQEIKKYFEQMNVFDKCQFDISLSINDLVEKIGNVKKDIRKVLESDKSFSDCQNIRDILKSNKGFSGCQNIRDGLKIFFDEKSYQNK